MWPEDAGARSGCGSTSFAAALVQVAVLALLEPIALLLAAPWLAAAAWAVPRKGVPGELADLPSAAEEARRRLAVR